MTPEITFTDLLYNCVNRRDLSRAQACAAMQRIMAGELSSPQIAALVVALRIKGETEDEITGFVEAMRNGAYRQ